MSVKFAKMFEFQKSVNFLLKKFKFKIYVKFNKFSIASNLCFNFLSFYVNLFHIPIRIKYPNDHRKHS